MEQRMRGLGEFQRGQMKQADPLVGELFRNLRQAVDILEQLTMRSLSPSSFSDGLKEVIREAVGSQPPSRSGEERLTVTIKDACRRSGLSRTRIYEAIGSGELQAIKCGRRTLIKFQDLEGWIDSWPLAARAKSRRY
jgi:excisionase family DNA binding protein